MTGIEDDDAHGTSGALGDEPGGNDRILLALSCLSRWSPVVAGGPQLRRSRTRPVHSQPPTRAPKAEHGMGHVHGGITRKNGLVFPRVWE
jgi:hypothetical protein